MSTASLFAADVETASRLTGKVVDPQGAAVAGAVVKAIRVGSSIERQAVTDGEGQFSLDLVQAEFLVTVSADGFEIVQRKVDLASRVVGDEKFVLEVRQATANVTVSDAALYVADDTRTATKTFTPLRDVPQSISIVKREQIRDQQMGSIADVVRYVPGVSSHQGENNRDDIIFRGNRSSADFYRNGVRDDVQYFRDLYNLDRVEVIKGPNAMTFGRGGGGGVLNRVVKEAKFAPIREFTATGGSFYDRRFSGDIGDALSKSVAYRINGVYEKSDSFRRFVKLERGGINPSFTISPDSKTSINVAYEFFRDRRTADRGVTSYQGRPADVPISTFYGDPANSKVRSDVHFIAGSLERLFGKLIFRNHTSFGDYDRFYQNYVPGAANAAKTLVALSAYNNATRRKNLFNQTDLIYSLETGFVKHTLLGGVEFGRQRTRNLRNTGYFNNLATSILVDFNDPVTSVPVTWRPSATDANNRLDLRLGAGYVQDQLQLGRFVQAIAGMRYDHFDLQYVNVRNGDRLRRIDRLFSPRFGVVLKPIEALSLYGSYTTSHLPSAGDQFSSLTSVTQQVKPEKFENYEAGVKWDVRRGLFLSAAVYRLDRTNTRSTDPNDPTRIVQTGSQRTDGFEIGLTGNPTTAWTISGGYSNQHARITSATTAAPAGRTVAQVPRNSFSLWNKYQITRRLGAGLGLVYRSDMFAAIDNTVVLPAYLKGDAAVYYTFNEHWRLQANVENITNKRYFVNADGNTNISPGSPRGVKLQLIAKF